MKISLDQAAKVLTDTLVGEFIRQVTIGDAWEFCFSNDVWLVAQGVGSSDTSRLERLIGPFKPNLLDGADSEDVAIATLVTSNMRRQVSGVGLRQDARISLEFGESRSLEILTDDDVVDWQWSLGACPQIPYSTEFRVACFWRGEVEVPGKDPHAA